MSLNGEGEEDHIVTSSLTFLDFEYGADTQGSQFEYGDFSLASQTQTQTQQLGTAMTQESEKFAVAGQEGASQPGTVSVKLLAVSTCLL